MKKIFSIFAIVAMSFALVACGGDKKKDAGKSELEQKAEHYGKLRAFYMIYDNEAAYDAALAESEAWIEKHGSEAEDLMVKYYDETFAAAGELFRNNVPMDEAKKQLGIE